MVERENLLGEYLVLSIKWMECGENNITLLY